jgi:hypothetical protein
VTVRHVAHDHELSCIGWHLLQSEPDLGVEGGGDRLDVVKAETSQDRVDVGLLREMDQPTSPIALHLNAEHPVKLAEVRNLKVLAEPSLESFNSCGTAGSNGAVVDVDCNYDEGVWHFCVLVEYRLIHLALREAKTAEDLCELLVPAPTSVMPC